MSNKLPSVMNHAFARTPTVAMARSRFDRSHGFKTAFDADYLVPILVDEILPGDSVNCRLTAFARFATLLKPIMDNVYLDTFFFFVPNRLLWTNWEKLNGAQTNPGDSISYTVPTVPMAAGGPEINTLWDYFGIPTDQTNGFNIAAFHSRAYNLIYNTWFRSQELQNSVVVDVDDGPDTQADYVLLKRGKRHDYFTSCLLAPQRGTAVSMNLGTSAPVTLVPTSSSTNAMLLRDASSNALPGIAIDLYAEATSGELTYNGGGAGDEHVIDPNGRLIADLSTATSATINQLRQSFATQELLERDARGGTRYTEILANHFRVTSPDFRIQRPEYLGGGSSPINVHPVAQTAITSGSNALGQLAAFGTSSFSGHGFNKSFTEHGVIIGLANVRADLTYSQGLNRMWSRSTRYDFYWPSFANLGEQSVLNKEIYNDLADGTSSNQREGVFGYIPRYDEYRYKPSQITSVFRPAYATPLDSWHLSQEFSAQPTLNSTFITADTPADRVIAVTSEPHILLDGYFNYIHARPMPVFAVPQLGARI